MICPLRSLLHILPVKPHFLGTDDATWCFQYWILLSHFAELWKAPDLCHPTILSKIIASIFECGQFYPKNENHENQVANLIGWAHRITVRPRRSPIRMLKHR